MYNLSEPQINEICKAIVYGRTFEDISSVENVPLDTVKEISQKESQRIEELKNWYKEIGVI